VNKVVRERFRNYDKALVIQAKEYKRRLKDLNGEAKRIKENQDKSISVEKFEGTVNQLHGRIDQLQKEIQVLSDGAKKAEGRGAWTERYIPWGIAVVLAIITILLSYFQVRNEL
jgi:predicted  nucleic acid-binding Zn-ribbon protein